MNQRRVAITLGRLAIPPSYFVLESAERASRKYEVRLLAQRILVRDEEIVNEWGFAAT